MIESNDAPASVSFAAPAAALAPLVTTYYFINVFAATVVDQLHPELGQSATADKRRLWLACGS